MALDVFAIVRIEMTHINMGYEPINIESIVAVPAVVL